MLNIVIPMAGNGSRFIRAGYVAPKPLISVGGRPMIRLVIENLRPQRPHRFVFVVPEVLLSGGYDLQERLRRWAGDRVEIVPVSATTEGAACTVLLAEAFLNNSGPLMIANCDQWVDADINEYLAAGDDPAADGLLMTMWADDPKWSFVRTDSGGRPVEVAEKRVIGRHATVGVYNFRRGEDFVRAARAMVGKNLRVNGEFYVAPVYNELLAGGADIRLFNVGPAGVGMHGLGTPQDLEEFLRSPACEKAIIR